MDTMAIDQFGCTWHNLGPSPRSELLRILGRHRAEKMYATKDDGTDVHIGYVIAGHWFTLYTVEPWEKPA